MLLLIKKNVKQTHFTNKKVTTLLFSSESYSFLGESQYTLPIIKEKTKTSTMNNYRYHSLLGRVVYSLVFYVVSWILLFVCLSFSFLAMALSVYFRFMSLTVPLVSFVPLS